MFGTFGRCRSQRRLMERAAKEETALCGEVRDRLKEMDGQLKATVAEQDRRAVVAEELKTKRGQDLRKHCVMAYKKSKKLAETRDQLHETQEKFKKKELELFESEKRARGLTQKLTMCVFCLLSD
eukprot:773417-Pleurochrysis_carterae.AAC.1